MRVALRRQGESVVPYAILVEFDIFPGMEMRFEECILKNAKSSKDDEPRCRVFDVLQRPDSCGLRRASAH